MNNKQDKLLSDEELFNKWILPEMVTVDAEDSMDGKPIYVSDLEDIKARFIADMKEQKRLYAESVIGEDEPIPEFGTMSEKKLNRIELRAEQRARIK